MNRDSLEYVYGRTLADLGDEFDDIVVLDADSSRASGTSLFTERHAERFLQMGISQQDLVSTAAGLAMDGKLVFATTMAAFIGRAWEQLRIDVAGPGLPVRLVGIGAGLPTATAGGPGGSLEDIALARCIPGLEVYDVSDAGILASLLRSLSVYRDRSAYIRLGRCSSWQSRSEAEPGQDGETSEGNVSQRGLGQGRTVPAGNSAAPVYDAPATDPRIPAPARVAGPAVLRRGEDLTIVASGATIPNCIEAAEILDNAGLSVTVLAVTAIEPLDGTIVRNAAETTGGRVLTVEEHSVSGGLGSAVCELLCQAAPQTTIHRPFVCKIGADGCFGPSGDIDVLLEHYGLTPAAIAERARSIF